MCLNYFKGRETFTKNIVRPVNGKCYFTYAVIRKFLCPQHSRPTKKKKKKKNISPPLAVIYRYMNSSREQYIQKVSSTFLLI